MKTGRQKELRRRGASGKLQRIAVIDDGVTVKEILNNEWPNAEIVSVKDTDECVQRLVNENVDGALLMTYTAQRLTGVSTVCGKKRFTTYHERAERKLCRAMWKMWRHRPSWRICLTTRCIWWH